MSRLSVPNIAHSLSSITSHLSVPGIEFARRSFERLSGIFKSKKPQLKRELSLVSSVNLIVNGTIGSGIFITPGIVLLHSGSVGMSLVIWAVCGGISMLGALAFAELGIVVPKSGAQYAFFQAAFKDLHPFYGPVTGFIFVWMNVLIVYPATLAIFCLTFTEYTHKSLGALCGTQLDPEMENRLKILISFLALGIMGYINLVSVKLYVHVQNMFSYLKLSICAMVILGAVYVQATGQAHSLYLGFQGTNYSTKGLIMAFYSGLYTFDGWCIVTGVTEEIKNPNKNILFSILIAVPLVTGLYLSVNLAYLTMLTIPQMVSESAVAVVFGDLVFGKWKLVISLGVAFSAFGSGLCNVFAASRLSYVAARDGHLVESLSYIHMDNLTPVPAILLQIALTGVFLLAGDMVSLINFSNFLLWIFYGLTMVTVFVLRRTRPDANRSYKVPLVIPALVMVIALMLAVIPLVTQPPLQYIVALALIVLGVVVYYPFVYRKLSLPYMDKFTYVVQVLLQVVPAAEPDPL
uniref:Amino acid permease/ SLC12A domain-containing protein n=1 Tax=Graphocephala atropunctata TaxID=36148 RepID=A0A1B6KW42_9HEMI